MVFEPAMNNQTFLFRIFQLVKVMLQSLAFFLYGLVYERYKAQTKYIPPITNEILTLPATVLASKIINKELKSEDVVLAFGQRIQQVNCVLNFKVDFRLGFAVEDARQVDQLVARSTPVELSRLRAEKPFLGVPFTTKDNIGVSGMAMLAGLFSRAVSSKVVRSDAEVVRKMRAAGAIPLVTTTIPELGMAFETVSLRNFRTNNPYHPGRIAGGSSGGEGVAIAGAASVIGVGSDVGGSIRIPAFFNGIFGHKPTAGSVPNAGAMWPPPTAGPICDSYLQCGPMCRYAADLLPMMRVLAKPEAALSMRLSGPLPNPKRMKVYYMPAIEGMILESPVHESLKVAQKRMVRELQRKLGVSVEMKDLSDSFRNSLKMWSVKMATDNSRLPHKQYMAGGEGHEPVQPLMELGRWLLGFGFGPWCRHTFSSITYAIAEDLTKAYLKRWPDVEKQVDQEVIDLRTELDNLLGEDGVLIFQSHPTPAPYHAMPCIPLAFNFSYTAIFNVLGNPVCQVPLGLGYWDVPVGMQIVAAHNRDVNCISMAVAVEEIFGGWVPPCKVQLPGVLAD